MCICWSDSGDSCLVCPYIANPEIEDGFAAGTRISGIAIHLTSNWI
jgi:hypothetical protein